MRVVVMRRRVKVGRGDEAMWGRNMRAGGGEVCVGGAVMYAGRGDYASKGGFKHASRWHSNMRPGGIQLCGRVRFTLSSALDSPFRPYEHKFYSLLQMMLVLYYHLATSRTACTLTGWYYSDYSSRLQ